MVADLSLLPGLPGDLLRGHAVVALRLVLVLQDGQGNVVPLHPAASTVQGGMQSGHATGLPISLQLWLCVDSRHI